MAHGRSPMGRAQGNQAMALLLPILVMVTLYLPELLGGGITPLTDAEERALRRVLFVSWPVAVGAWLWVKSSVDLESPAWLRVGSLYVVWNTALANALVNIAYGVFADRAVMIGLGYAFVLLSSATVRIRYYGLDLSREYI